MGMKRFLFTIIALFFLILNNSCSREKSSNESGKNIESVEEGTQLPDSLAYYFTFDVDTWIDNRLNDSDFTASQKNCLRNSLVSCFDCLSSYVNSSLIKSSPWKQIKLSRRFERESLYIELNNRLLEGDVSFKSCEFLINESIFRFNDTQMSEILHTISLPRIPNKSIIHPDLVKGLFIYIEKNYSNLTRKEKKKVEISLLVSAISKQYADVFDNNNLFDQTK